MQSIGGWQFSFGGGAKDSSNPRNRQIRVLLLGQPKVGKTAVAVRYASRRFIGEYDSGTERIYRLDDKHANWEIADPPGDLARAPNESRLRWADAILLVYSVTDRVSFDEIWRLRFLLNQARKTINGGGVVVVVGGGRKTCQVPVVVLLGNKIDAGDDEAGDRMVTTYEGRKRAVDIEAQDFHEISARESYDQIEAVFASTARLVQLLLRPPLTPVEDLTASFRLRASTDGSIDAKRRPQIQEARRRRLSISARGAMN